MLSARDSSLTQRARTFASKAFLGYCPVGAVSSQYATAQIWNPLATGKNLTLKSILVSSPTAQPVFLAFGTTAGTLLTTARNKLLGGAAGVGETRTDNSVGGLTVVANIGQFDVLASSPLLLKLEEPILIPPGYGIAIQAGTVNTKINVLFETTEDGA